MSQCNNFNSQCNYNSEVALDSGASMFLVNDHSSDLIGGVTDMDVLLDTVTGVNHVRTGAWCRFPLLDGWFQSLRLPNTPNCASLGRLVEEMGYQFSWTQGRCFLRNPQGEWKHLVVKNFVPFLEEVHEYEGSDDEFYAIASECVAALGESHPDLPYVLDGLTWLRRRGAASACARRAPSHHPMRMRLRERLCRRPKGR